MAVYESGRWWGVVAPAGVALIAPETEIGVLPAVGEALAQPAGIDAVLGTFVTVYGAAFATALPSFAAVAFDVDGRGARVVVRGRASVSVTDAAGGVSNVVAAAGTIWTERVVDDVDTVVVRHDDAETADGADRLPLRDGIVRAGLVEWSTADAIAYGARMPRPRDAPSTQALPVTDVVPAAQAQALPVADVAPSHVPSPAEELPSTTEALSSTTEEPPADPEPSVEDQPSIEAVAPVAEATSTSPEPSPGWPGFAAVSTSAHEDIPPQLDEVVAPRVSLRKTALGEPASPQPASVLSPAEVAGAGDTMAPREDAADDHGFGTTYPPSDSWDDDLDSPEHTSDYDLLFGETRTTDVEAAAVRPVDPDDDAVAPASASFIAAIPGGGAPAAALGDHDGLTVAGAQLAELVARAGVPAAASGEGARAVPVLVTSAGERFTLDRGAVVGVRPAAVRATGMLPHLVAVSSPSSEISRRHLEIRVEGQNVLAVDLDSTNGSRLLRIGAEPVRLQPGVATLLVSGDRLDLGDGVVLDFEGLR